MEVKNCTNVALCDLFLVVRVNQECKSNSVCTERRLDNVRSIVLAGLLDRKSVV